MFKRFMILIVMLIILFSMAHAISWQKFMYNLLADSTDADGTFIVYVVSGSVSSVMGNDFTLLYSTTTKAVIDKMDLNFILESSNTAAMLGKLDNQLILISTNSDAALAKWDAYHLLASTNNASVLNKWDAYHLLASTNAKTMADKHDLFFTKTSTDTKAVLDKHDALLIKLSTGVPDPRYYNKVSTGTDGRLVYDAASPTQNFSPGDEAIIISFYAEGGNVNITSTWRSGTIYVREGIPLSVEAKTPLNNPTFQCALSEGSTLYYYSDEVN